MDFVSTIKFKIKQSLRNDQTYKSDSDLNFLSFNLADDNISKSYFALKSKRPCFHFIHDNAYFMAFGVAKNYNKHSDTKSLAQVLTHNPKHHAIISDTFDNTNLINNPDFNKLKENTCYLANISFYTTDLKKWQIALCSENGFSDVTQLLDSLELDQLNDQQITAKQNNNTHQLELNKEQWCKKTNQLIRELGDSKQDFTKCVLARQKDIYYDTTINPLALLRRTVSIHKKDTYFFKKTIEGTTFLGATPECLLKVDQGNIYIDAIAGTRALTKNESTAKLSTQLLESKKDLLEHQAVIDQIRDVLSPIAKVDIGTQGILNLKNLIHIKTPISAQFYDDRDPVTKLTSMIDLISNLHPTPAVGGSPKKVALDYIKNNENLDRGLYAAPIGLINQNSITIAVGIRSALITGSKLSLFAGAGIVKDSNANEEYQEIENKLYSFLPESIFNTSNDSNLTQELQ